MYLLDTSLVAELWKIEAGRADPGVAAWSADIDAAAAFLSVVTVMELELGIRRLAERDEAQSHLLQRHFAGQILRDFADRILAIDPPVALRCAEMHRTARLADRDGWVAATAAVHSLTLVTRETADFDGVGIRSFNPWSSPSEGQLS